MLFKDISYLELWKPSGELFLQFWKRVSSGTILLNYFEFGPVVYDISYKDISYLELWRPFCLAERNNLCNFLESIMRNNSVKSF